MDPKRLSAIKILAGFGAFMLLVADCLAQTPIEDDAKRLREEEASRISSEVVALYDANKFSEAIPLAQKHVQFMQELFGPDHPKHLTSLRNLALVYLAAGQDDQARPLFEKVAAAWKQRREQLLIEYHSLPAPGNLHADDSREILIRQVEAAEAEVLESVEDGSPDAAQLFERARARFFDQPPPLGGKRYDNADERQLAIDATRSVLKHQIAVLGEAGPTVDWTRTLLYLLLREADQTSAAMSLVEESQAAWVRKSGESSPRVGWLSGYVGELLQRDDPSALWIWELHRWQKSAEAARAAEDADREILALETAVRIQRDELQWDSALNEASRLAELCELRGDLQRAAHWHRQYAASVLLRSSASHEATTAMVAAERLDLLSRLDPEQRTEFTEAIEQLHVAKQLLRNDQFADALDRARAAQDALQRLGGDDHILTLQAETAAGSALLKMQNIQEAVTVLESAAKRMEWSGLFAESSISGDLLGGLGDCYLRTDPARAKELHQRAVRQLARAQVLWSDDDLHWREISSRHALAELAWVDGHLPEAWQHLSEVLSGCHIHRERTFNGLSEKGQIQALRRYQYAISDYMSVSTEINRDVAEEYDVVVGWEGASLRRLGRWRSISTGRASTDPEASEVLQEIRSAVGQLAAWRLSPDAAKDPNLEAKSSALQRRLSELETRLDSDRQIQMNVIQSNLQLSDGELAQTAAELVNWSERNPDVALVDYFEYEHAARPAAADQPWVTERRLLCYVLRGGQIVRFCPGNATSIHRLLTDWLSRLQGKSRTEVDATSPEMQLRKLIWEPLEKWLSGAKLTVISPSGVLTQLPFAALPGRQPGTFLVEEQTIAFLPAMQLIQEYFTESFDDPLIPGLVCLGGADFTSGPGSYSSLPGTAKEASEIHRIYRETHADGKSVLLQGAAATKSALFENASQAQYLLLATHGFSFQEDSPEAASLPARVSIRGNQLPPPSGAAFPDLRSGLVLAHGNDVSLSGIEQNWLTAAEAAFLPLRKCRLVILSACETGIGQLEGYEGMWSLQRALQVAGAQATISSLWKVPDNTTQLLMIRFFENHWKRGMTKAEALREAQVWLLRGEYRASPEMRGAKIAGPPVDSGPLPAVYWAGFTLNGNWE